jgi:hypothetical protein
MEWRQVENGDAAEVIERLQGTAQPADEPKIGYISKRESEIGVSRMNRLDVGNRSWTLEHFDIERRPGSVIRSSERVAERLEPRTG